MKILLNDNLLEVDGVTEETTLFQLLETVEQSLQGTGATVVEIIADDQILMPDDSDKLQQTMLNGFGQIHLKTATASDMIRIAIEDGAEALGHLEEMAVDISADLRIAKVKDAMDKYVEFVDGIEWFITVLKNAERSFAHAMAESSLEAERQSIISRLTEQMDTIHAMQESEDWVGMADILEYEYPEIFQDGQKLFAQLTKE